MRKGLHILLLVLFSTALSAQDVVLDRVLIGSGYSEYASAEFNLSASVGESMVTTEETTELIITQGFQQSNYILAEPYIATMGFDSAACLGSNDGAAYVTFVSGNIASPYTYSWSNGSIEDTLTQITAGTYTVTITGDNGKSVTNQVTVEAIDDVDCTPGFYTGITPNADGFNDYWHVDNADFFNEKKVQIFNRYGAKVWETDAYDNFSENFSGLHRNGRELPDGTYFFIAKFDASEYKGWIEISR